MRFDWIPEAINRGTMSPLLEPVVILVRPQSPGNVGALARVMSNFGLRELRIVDDSNGNKLDYHSIDWALATEHGQCILSQSPHYPTLNEALCDIHVAMGTTGQSRSFSKDFDRDVLEPQQAWEWAREWIRHARAVNNEPFQWALVFGPERDGLSAEEVSLCHQLIRIPTAGPNPSMNVAMAAGILISQYALRLQDSAETESQYSQNRFAHPENVNAPSSHADRERFVSVWSEALKLSSFFMHHSEARAQALLRRCLQKSFFHRRDLEAMTTMMRSLRSALAARSIAAPPPPADDLTTEPKNAP